MPAYVEAINVYPIKSGGPMPVSEAAVTDHGLAFDREWAVVAPTKSGFLPLTQRTHPQLALLEPFIDGDCLNVTGPKGGELALSIDPEPAGEEIPVTLFKKTGTAIDQGDGPALFVSSELGVEGGRLFRIKQPRQVEQEGRTDGYTHNIGFADGYTLSLASSSSLAELNEHVAAFLAEHPEIGFQYPVPMGNFRPNLVVGGAEAFAEDHWRKLCLGGLKAIVAKANARCPIPNVDQRSGTLVRDPKHRVVTQVLRAWRLGINTLNGEKGEFFAQNLVYQLGSDAVIRVMDPVTVLERSDEPNWHPASSQ